MRKIAHGESGQALSEYAIILLAIALIVIVVLAVIASALHLLPTF